MHAIAHETPEATILVVDDTPANLHLLRQIMGARGLTVRCAPDGARAVKYARSNPPDLILLDIKMPGMDGFEVMQALQADDITRQIPVIFLSALHDVIDKVKALSLGGIDYITKPFQEEEVLARIQVHLRLRSLQRSLEEKNAQLEEALSKVKQLTGLLPICAHCKKIRDDQGYWHQIEIYIREHSEAEFSHALCPRCVKVLYPDLYDRLKVCRSED